eukprot:6864130-Pyramimonas_sp.AAC.1
MRAHITRVHTSHEGGHTRALHEGTHHTRVDEGTRGHTSHEGTRGHYTSTQHEGTSQMRALVLVVVQRGGVDPGPHDARVPQMPEAVPHRVVHEGRLQLVLEHAATGRPPHCLVRAARDRVRVPQASHLLRKEEEAGDRVGISLPFHCDEPSPSKCRGSKRLQRPGSKRRAWTQSREPMFKLSQDKSPYGVPVEAALWSLWWLGATRLVFCNSHRNRPVSQPSDSPVPTLRGECPAPFREFPTTTTITTTTTF